MPLDRLSAVKKIHLTTDELVDLTDRRLPSKQIEWLDQNGWKYAISAAGRPKVARSFYELKLGTVNIDQDPADQEPDFSSWASNGRKTKKEPRTRHDQAVRL